MLNKSLLCQLFLHCSRPNNLKEIKKILISYEVIRHLGYLSDPWKRRGLPVGSMPTPRIWFGGILGHLRVLGAAHISSRERYGDYGAGPSSRFVGRGAAPGRDSGIDLNHPPIYLDLNKPPIYGGSPPSAGLKIVDSRRISHSGQAERNEAALLRSVEQLMAGGQKARGARIRYASSHELV